MKPVLIVTGGSRESEPPLHVSRGSAAMRSRSRIAARGRSPSTSCGT